MIILTLTSSSNTFSRVPALPEQVHKVLNSYDSQYLRLMKLISLSLSYFLIYKAKLQSHKVMDRPTPNTFLHFYTLLTQASLLSGKILNPSSTSAPSSMVHRGMQTNDSFTLASFSSLAHRVRQKPNLSSIAVRYQVRRRRSGEPFRGSYPGLQRPAILMPSMRMRMPSNTQTGRKMRNQFHCTWSQEIEKMITWKRIAFFQNLV